MSLPASRDNVAYILIVLVLAQVESTSGAGGLVYLIGDYGIYLRLWNCPFLFLNVTLFGEGGGH